MSNYPRETVEFQPVTVTVNGALITTGVTFSVVAGDLRPTTWIAPTTLDGKIGIMITGLTPGIYQIYAKVVSTPEIPVLDCGTFRIT